MSNDVLKEKIKKLSWFPDYQSFPELGIKGLRDSNERYIFFNKNDLINKTVIDYGCSLGQASIFSKRSGASKVLGVDCQKDTIECAQEIVKQLKVDVDYLTVDFNNKKFNNFIPSLLSDGSKYKSDMALFLSVYGTHELKHREMLLKTILDNTKEQIYFEGHNNDRIAQYSKIFLKQKFDIKSFEFYGFTRDNYFVDQRNSSIRPFFILSKKSLGYQELIQKLRELKNKSGGRLKIGVEGKSCSGKSYLLDKIKNDVFGDKSILVIDDLVSDYGQKYKPKHRKLKFLNKLFRDEAKPYVDEVVFEAEDVIISDGRIRQYLKYLDVLISLRVDENLRKERLINRYGNQTAVPKSFWYETVIQDNDFNCRHYFVFNNSF